MEERDLREIQREMKLALAEFKVELVKEYATFATAASLEKFKEEVVESFGEVHKRLKPLEEALVTNKSTTALKDKGIAFLAALAIAIISALIYVGSTGGFH